MTEKFRIKRPQRQQDVSRNLDHHSYHAGPYHTIRKPQDWTAYDPWADWFNAGLDPEPFTDHFATELEESNPPSFFAESPDLNTPWFIPQAEPEDQEEQETPRRQTQPEDPGEDGSYGYPGSQDRQDKQEQPLGGKEQTSEYIGISSSVSEEEVLPELSPDRSESHETAAAWPPDQAQRESETPVEAKRNSEDVDMDERGKEIETQEQKSSRRNLEPLVWKDFPEKSC